MAERDVNTGDRITNSGGKKGKKGSAKKRVPGTGERNDPRTDRRQRPPRKANLASMMEALSLDSLNKQPQGVGVVYDDRMLAPLCSWDSNHPEKPERLAACLQRCREYGLLQRCTTIPSRWATEDEVVSLHSEEYFEEVKGTAEMTEDKLKALSAKYDGVYYHNCTFEAAMLAAGCAIEAAEHVVTGKVRHSMALTRPPGHHAMKAESCGYCFFNNVALAASYALDNLGLDRVLIVDWDVHHGQGTQQLFYDDPRVLYFSIHRFEFGRFWPNLRESDFYNIGEKRGKGFNVNMPFNEVGMTDGDYMTMLHQVLMPLASEFNPELVLVSSGYDAALGDPEGESSISPAFYAHATHMLKTLARGRLAVILEGGYCIRTLAEGAALTLRCLLGDPCPPLGTLAPPNERTRDAILQSIRVLRPFWKCFAFHEDADKVGDLPEVFRRSIQFLHSSPRPESFAIVGDYITQDAQVTARLAAEIDLLIAETSLAVPADRTCVVYDEGMRRHKCYSSVEDYMVHPERPDRITRIYERHEELGLLKRCKALKSRLATEDEILLTHMKDYFNDVRDFKDKTQSELEELSAGYQSVYLSPEVFECACLATGCTLAVVDDVMSGLSQNGVAIVRPPGHHAEAHTAMGFCYFNSVAVAARYAQLNHGAKRVLILDWDVHHGNGTQRMFLDDPSVLYISLHRYDNGFFFPIGPEGNYDVVGTEAGAGFNVNIPWNSRSIGDAEYLAAFQQVVMPVAYEFAPDLVLVSAGFDAARGDPLGGCRVTPEGFALMTQMLSGLAGGRVVLVLEGGYNLVAISDSMAACTSILLGDACPMINRAPPSDQAVTSIRCVLNAHATYWKSLNYRVKMPSRAATAEWLKEPSQQPKAKFRGVTMLPPATTDVLPKEEAGESESSETVKQEPEMNAGSAPEMTLKQETEADMDDLAKEMQNVTVSDTGVGQNPWLSSAAATEQSDVTLTTTGADPASDQLLGACGGSDHVTGKSYEDFLQSVAGGKESLEMFTVTPLPWCPHLADHVSSPPPESLDVWAACVECGNKGENWVCLSCHQVHCSRFVNEHMLMHGLETGHLLVLSYADLSVWCYGCDAYIHNELLLPAKDAAHRSKFGENIPH